MQKVKIWKFQNFGLGVWFWAVSWKWATFDQRCPYIIFMILEELSGQEGLVFLWWNFSVVFRWLKFKMWFLGFLYQNVLLSKTCKNIWWGWENISGLYLQLVVNNVHGFNLFLYCIGKPGLGVKSHILKFHKNMWFSIWPFCTCSESFMTCDSILKHHALVATNS